MAEKIDENVTMEEGMTDGGTPKTTTEEPTPSTAPAAVSETGDNVNEEDFDQTIALLNEIDMAFDGKGGITGVPMELRPVIKTMIDQMVGFREAFEDPDFKAILDDLLDQRADGKTPSVRVAIARNIPSEELISLAEGGDEEEVQNAVSERAASEKKRMDEEMNLESNINGSLKAIDAYAKSMGYDDAETADFHNTIKTLMGIFGDGKITEAECEAIDKMRNYDKDMQELRGQLPKEPKKEILPDKASMETMTQQTTRQESKPRNTIEAMGSMIPQTDVTQIGSRKRYGGRS